MVVRAYFHVSSEHAGKERMMRAFFGSEENFDAIGSLDTDT
jgi:hypothetical protein